MEMDFSGLNYRLRLYRNSFLYCSGEEGDRSKEVVVTWLAFCIYITSCFTLLPLQPEQP
jgi:hypothetical protein